MENPTFIFKATAYNEMISYLKSDTTIEQGGFLLGKKLIDKDEILISVFLKAKSTVSTSSSLQFTSLTWCDLDDRKTKDYPKLELLGWVHTHPGMGVFLSKYDESVNAFFEYIAIVFDPLSDEIGYFYLKETPPKSVQVIIKDFDLNEHVTTTRNYLFQMDDQISKKIQHQKSIEDYCGANKFLNGMENIILNIINNIISN